MLCQVENVLVQHTLSPGLLHTGRKHIEGTEIMIVQEDVGTITVKYWEQQIGKRESSFPTACG